LGGAEPGNQAADGRIPGLIPASIVSLVLIFAELGRVSGIFNNEIYAGLIIVIAITTLLPPFAMKWYYGRWGHRLATG